MVFGSTTLSHCSRTAGRATLCHSSRTAGTKAVTGVKTAALTSQQTAASHLTSSVHPSQCSPTSLLEVTDQVQRRHSHKRQSVSGLTFLLVAALCPPQAAQEGLLLCADSQAGVTRVKGIGGRVGLRLGLLHDQQG